MNIARLIAAQLCLTQEATEEMFYEGQLSIIPAIHTVRVNRARRRRLMSVTTGIVSHDRILTGRYNIKYGGDESELLLPAVES